MAAEIRPEHAGPHGGLLAKRRRSADARPGKAALAISGWLLGTDAATVKLDMAVSAYRVRGMIRDYLNETTGPNRQRAYGYIKQEPAGTPAIVAELLSHMKPPPPIRPSPSPRSQSCS